MASDNIDIRTRLIGARKAAAEAKAVGSGVHGIGTAADHADKHSRRMGKGFVYARKGIGPLRAGVTGLTGALGFGGAVGLAGAFKLMYTEAQESVTTAKQTDAALKSNKANAWITRKSIEGYAQSLSNLSGIDDEAIQSGENFLLTFNKIRNETGKGNDVFKQTSGIMVDFAARFTNGDMEQSAKMLGKALQDPTKGLTAMNRAGVSFSKGESDKIKKLQESGHLLEAQKLILSKVKPQVAGYAKASTTPMQKLNTTFHNVAETLGLKLLPFVNKAATAVNKWVHQVVNGTGAGGRFRDKVVAIWKAAKPVVFWFGRAAANAFRFASKHPGLVKVATALFLASKALRIMRFGSAISGAQTLFSWLGRSEKRIEKMPAKAAATKGKWTSVGGMLGKTLGAAAFAAFVVEFSPQLNRWLEKQLNKYGINDPLGLDAGGPGADPRKLVGQGKHSLAPGGISWDEYFRRKDAKRRRNAATNRHIRRGLDPNAAPHDEGGGPRPRVAAAPAGPVIHNHFHVDGKEVATSTARRTQDSRNRR